MHAQMKRLYEAANKRHELVGQSAVATFLNMSPQVLNNWEARGMSKKGILQACQLLNVSALWLAEGVGEMDYGKPSPSTEQKQNQFSSVVAAEPGDINLIEVKTVKLKLRAGITGFATEQSESDGKPITFNKSWLQTKGLFVEDLVAIKVVGDSMHPFIPDGATVVINTADKEMKDGKVYAFNYEGEAVIKRLQRDIGEWFLTSDNMDQRTYPPKRCRGAECLVLGRIVHMQSDKAFE